MRTHWLFFHVFLLILILCVFVTPPKSLNLFPQVNGRNILSVDYDRTLRTEKIYDDHRKFLLKIIYDTAGHPVLWVPSSKLLPVNVSRTSSGQISALQRGPTTERLEYDSQGRLISRVFADGKIWSYTYLEQVRKYLDQIKYYVRHMVSQAWLRLLEINRDFKIPRRKSYSSYLLSKLCLNQNSQLTL